jgi:predicted deacetylase
LLHFVTITDDYFNFVSGLVAFNIGVELAQLAVIAACFLGVGLWFRTKDWYRRRIAIPASAAVALVGSYWFILRVI